jgi:hypothetical protein
MAYPKNLSGLNDWTGRRPARRVAIPGQPRMPGWPERIARLPGTLANR